MHKLTFVTSRYGRAYSKIGIIGVMVIQHDWRKQCRKGQDLEKD